MEGVRYRAPGAISANVSSGIDWFDLAGSVRYGDVDVPIATILDARRRGDEFVAVGDGALGLMPVEWLEKLGPLIAAGDNVNGVTRYRRSQLSLLDALVATLPDTQLDVTFERARAELNTFDTVVAVDPPATFIGTLREYQREGLGWLHFLRRFGLGGCLADDMGLGKTVQVLALLEDRRAEGHGPSLVVVPRSLVFNWMREAARFAPGLRMLDFSGGDRNFASISAEHVDVVVATYGSLRRDAPLLEGIEFDYAILDEAQAIKNATTATAKASRLLRAQHRLVMSGTPIENRIEELWSLLEFLNPGMLGASTKFSTLARLSSVQASDTTTRTEADGRALLARALRPVILRRTKEQVAPELPMRIEQTLEVELEPKQRKFYESVRKLVREKVMDRVEKQGLQKSQLHILEALLRLRQAACHPALVDQSKKLLPSAKLDALIPALTSIAAEGHKSLVFSQFTEFLALVRERLDASGIRYEYLDGSTRDRQARVDSFQSDAECPVFLISLKAGGHGLNLTAADYVYLLDPWWNPAVEAQAIDRVHRIGQTKRVIATRLVARDTIEAKILGLQATKRALADAVLTAEKGGLASIGRSELELLLG
jgi:SNF2 family DNA or RNA helicase